MRSFWALLLAVVMLAGTLSTGHAFGHPPGHHDGEGHMAAVDVSCRDACQEDGEATHPCCHEAVLHCAADAISSAGHGLAVASLSLAAFHPREIPHLRSPSAEAAIPPPRV